MIIQLILRGWNCRSLGMVQQTGYSTNWVVDGLPVYPPINYYLYQIGAIFRVSDNLLEGITNSYSLLGTNCPMVPQLAPITPLTLNPESLHIWSAWLYGIIITQGCKAMNHLNSPANTPPEFNDQHHQHIHQEYRHHVKHDSGSWHLQPPKKSEKSLLQYLHEYSCLPLV
jgi:hypothetical protein